MCFVLTLSLGRAVSEYQKIFKIRLAVAEIRVGGGNGGGGGVILVGGAAWVKNMMWGIK